MQWICPNDITKKCSCRWVCNNIKPIKPKKVKQKNCVVCNTLYTPINSLVKVCSSKCNIKLLKEKEKLKKTKIKEKKKVSIIALSKVADKLASEYIRKRDCLATTWTLTHWICITCWERKEYSQFDCWHFITRANRNTRWDEKNMSLQCKVCNCWGWWRQYEHWIALDKKWWEWTAQSLLNKSKQIKKLTSFELLEIIDFYKKELLQLNK